jgi:hypothetical protein
MDVQTGGNTLGIVVQEVAGLLAGGSPLDGAIASVTGTGGAATGSPAYSSAVAGEYLVTFYSDNGGPATFTGPAGYTVDANSVNSNADNDVGVAYKLSTGGAETDGWTLTVSGQQWAVMEVAFKLAPAGRALILSMASASGTDPVTGANYPQGFASFNFGNPLEFINMNDQDVTVRFPGQANIGGLFLDTPGNYRLISGQNVPGDSEAGVFVQSGTASGLIGNIGLIQLLADNVQLLNSSFNIPGPAVPGFLIPLGSSTNAVITAVNALYNTLIGLGLIQ